MGFKDAKKRNWTDDELNTADLVHGPDRLNSDTYRLHYVKPGETNGKMLDVPGWMVGDPEGVKLRARAAEIIRERLAKQYAGLTPLDAG